MKRDTVLVLSGVSLLCVALFSGKYIYREMQYRAMIDEAKNQELKLDDYKYNPILHSENDITIELINKIVNNELHTLTIDYNFTRCMNEGESANEYKKERMSKNIFVRIDDEYYSKWHEYGYEYDIIIPVRFTSNVTTLACAFKDNQYLNYINIQDTSNINDMTSMFESARKFTGNPNYYNYDYRINEIKYNLSAISMRDWNISKVTSTFRMFKDAVSFNADISAWDTSNITDMSEMFSGAKHFAGEIGVWDTKNVQGMAMMFMATESFNSDIGNWNTKNVTDMNKMFYMSWFNRSINNWDTQNVVDMSDMFYGSRFNGSVYSWNTKNVKYMKEMFKNSHFNQPIDNWDTQNVVDMSYMFAMSKFNQPIDKWNTSKVKSFTRMFEDAVFNQPIGSWDTSSAEDMSYMFFENKVFNQPLNNWNTSNVTSMTAMFMRCSSFDQDLTSWNFSNVEDSTNFLYDNYSKYKSKIKERIDNANKTKKNNAKSKFHK